MFTRPVRRRVSHQVSHQDSLRESHQGNHQGSHQVSHQDSHQVSHQDSRPPTPQFPLASLQVSLLQVLQWTPSYPQDILRRSLRLPLDGPLLCLLARRGSLQASLVKIQAVSLLVNPLHNQLYRIFHRLSHPVLRVPLFPLEFIQPTVLPAPSQLTLLILVSVSRCR
jgi:hypothetical protein